MERQESYKFTSKEYIKMFEDKLGKKIARIRFSNKTGDISCEIRQPDEANKTVG